MRLEGALHALVLLEREACMVFTCFDRGQIKRLEGALNALVLPDREAPMGFICYCLFISYNFFIHSF